MDVMSSKCSENAWHFWRNATNFLTAKVLSSAWTMDMWWRLFFSKISQISPVHLPLFTASFRCWFFRNANDNFCLQKFDKFKPSPFTEKKPSPFILNLFFSILFSFCKFLNFFCYSTTDINLNFFFTLQYPISLYFLVKKKQLEKQKCMLALELSIYFHDFIELHSTCET